MNGRKSLKDISWQVSEEEYRADKAYSYSTLAKFDREGFENLDKLFDKVESPSLLFGSMVDTLLTDGETEYEKRFFVADFPVVSDTIKDIIKELHDLYGEECMNLTNISDEKILFVTDLHKYQQNWLPKTRVKSILEKGEQYYDLLHLSKDKTLVTVQQNQDARDCVNLLKTSSATKWYFEDDNPFDNSIERLYQLKFKGEFEGIPVRCMADLIIIDHKNKLIIPCDLKTSYKPEYNFYKSFIEWKYFVQSQLYAEIIKQNIQKDDYFKDFTITNYRFIVISNNTRNPLVWEYPDTWCMTDMVYGSNNQVKCKNWRSILKELDYYLKNESKTPMGVKNHNNLLQWLNKM